MENESTSSFSALPWEDSDSDSESSVGDVVKPIGRNIQSITTTSVEDHEELWYREASTSLFNAMEGDHPVAVASLELNGLRMTANASWHQVRRAVVTALINRIEQVVSKESLTNRLASENVLTRWNEIIKRCIFEREDQADFLLLSQRECSSRESGESLLLNIIQVLYNNLDLVEEEAINDWWLDERSSKEEKMHKVRKPTEAFVNWLAEASSESEEESEKEDSDDE
jgi:translation initiation factor eIF-2B subunit epsilon